jgi:acyl carrier protein
MAENARARRTVELIAEVIEVDASEVKVTDRLRDDLGLDSLQSLELLSLLAEELRVDLPMEAALDLGTVQDACDFVERAYQDDRGAPT